VSGRSFIIVEAGQVADPSDLDADIERCRDKRARLDAVLAPFREAGDEVITKDEWNDPTVGRFAGVHDPEGNPIELWEPPKE
jgi:hypothetical protein